MLVLLLSSVFGCSKLSTLIKWADTFVSFELDREFDFTRKQMKVVDAAIDQGLKDLKANMFSKYALVLQQASLDLLNLESGESGTLISKTAQVTKVAQILIDLRRKVQELQKQSVEVLKPQILIVANQINETNWKNFEQRFEKKNQDLRTMDLEERRESALDRIEEWTGELSSPQRKFVLQWLTENPWPADLRIKNREKLMFEFRKRLYISGKFETEKVSVAVAEWLKDYELWTLPQYRPAANQFLDNMSMMLAELFLDMSPKQKLKLFSTLNDRAAELQQFLK